MRESDGHDVELQQEIERFTTQFTDRVTQAMDTLAQSDRPDVRQEALRKNLLYQSSAVEIATGQFPVVNLLDMIVFVRLCRAVLERHWIPTLYGEAGRPVLDAFTWADEDLDRTAARTLEPAQREQLAELVSSWLNDNPDQTRVEGIRLSDFASAAGSQAGRAKQAGGLLAGVRSATQTANQALLLSERALFLVQRLPFLWRMHARLAGQEMIGDALFLITEGPQAPVPRLKDGAQQLARKLTLGAGLFTGVSMLARWLAGLVQRARA
jgi:hypothetical protein